jgi:hypothetical protein
LETIQRDYASRGVKFYYIYKSLAHPENNGYVQPLTLQERLLHLKEAERTLGSKFTWLADNMENELKHKLGNSPNSEFIFDPAGKVVRHRSWSAPSELRKDLEQLVGAVEKPTQVADLKLKTAPPPKAAASGVVPRVQVSGSMRAFKVTAEESKEPHYVKLRAEVDQNFMSNGLGKLYLGFHLDPLYHVHWNNLVDPLTYELELPENVTVTPAKGSGPKVKQPADIDPREFLLNIDELKQVSNAVIKVKVKYFACNDDEGWCKPVNQTFLLTLEADRDGGSSRQRGGRGGGRGGLAGGLAGGQRPGAGGRGRPQMANGSRVMGMIEKVDVKQRLITALDRSGGGKKTVHVPAGVAIIRNGQAAKLSDLQPQDRVMMVLTATPAKDSKVPGPASKTATARQIMARSGGFQPPGRRPPR